MLRLQWPLLVLADPGDSPISDTFRLPGELQEAQGMEVSGRDADIRTISAPGADGIEDEMVEFQKEMEQARVRWREAQTGEESPPERPGTGTRGWY